MDQIATLAEWIVSSERTVAFTGAGISTESGIPDFRGTGGVWSRHRPVQYGDFLSSRTERIRYWQMRHEAYPLFRDARPNTGHLAMAQLEQLDRLRVVITQNIDGLHQMAGSQAVIELHGTAREAECIACRHRYEPAVLHERMEAGAVELLCDECGGPIKSRTISFGQPMPAHEMMMAAQHAREARLFLAIGSSLVVEPAASLPVCAKQSGATLVIINATPTPLDEMADLVVHAPIGTTLAAVAEQVKHSA